MQKFAEEYCLVTRCSFLFLLSSGRYGLSFLLLIKEKGSKYLLVDAEYATPRTSPSSANYRTEGCLADTLYCNVVWNRQRKAGHDGFVVRFSVSVSVALMGHGVELTDYHDFDWFGLLSPVISSRQCSAKYRALVSRFGCERIAEARRQT